MVKGCKKDNACDNASEAAAFRSDVNQITDYLAVNVKKSPLFYQSMIVVLSIINYLFYYCYYDYFYCRHFPVIAAQ